MKELSRELKSLIAFGMEDQENSFYLDLRSMALIKNPEKILPENMEKIPEWKPADGFRLMEEFVSSLKSEEIKGELSSVLSEGKGVFKNFKLSMKKHPLIEKNWLRFKENKFDGLIENWFKLLSESRKLEILSREEDLIEPALKELRQAASAIPWNKLHYAGLFFAENAVWEWKAYQTLSL